MVPEWFTQLLCNLTVSSTLQNSGKRDEIPYAEAFMPLHQEKKESEDYHLMVWRSEEKLKTGNLDKRG